MKILFIGDIVGKIARHALIKELPGIKKKHKPDFVIANGENATHGDGISHTSFEELRGAGIDFFTLGDHTFRRGATRDLLEQESSLIIRPANYPPDVVGKGYAIRDIGSRKVLIINLLGRVFMRMDYDCPFRKFDEILEKNKKEKFAGIIVDFHAEATSEKNAFGIYADGRASAVFGTHTHVPTSDERIMPQGTAYVSDVGMVGAKNSVIGVEHEPIIKQFLEQTSHAFNPLEEGVCNIGMVMVTIDPRSERATNIKRIDTEVKV